MALRTRDAGVRARQRKGRYGVIVGGGPIGCSMTGLAGVRKSSQRVIGIQCSGVVGLMTQRAFGRSAAAIPAGMTLLTIDRIVCASEREIRGRMIECCRLPDGGRVAPRAIVRQIRRAVIGILSCAVNGLVARVAVGRQILILSVDVALLTTHGDVCAG
jgi:hypothetical protein